MRSIHKVIVDLVQDQKEIGVINQKQLAKKMGCSEATLSYLLSGTHQLREDYILKFCKALDISLIDLARLVEEGVPKRPPKEEVRSRKISFGSQELSSVEAEILRMTLAVIRSRFVQTKRALVLNVREFYEKVQLMISKKLFDEAEAEKKMRNEAYEYKPESSRKVG